MQIFDAILPVGRNSRAVVSTERCKYTTIPCGALMAELGGRINEARQYNGLFAAKRLGDDGIRSFCKYEKDSFGKPHLQRTTFECMLADQGYIDVTFT